MRLVEGSSLREIIVTTGPLPPARAVAIVAQIGAALDAAHRDGLVHRDVKPDNILLTPRDDFAYLVDFGIANSTTDERLTAIGGAVGSYGYMAPERFEEGPITAAADTYALACVLYECLTGRRPFRADTDAQVVRAHLFEPPPRPSVTRPGTPQALDPVIARGLAKNPGHRYATAGALAAAARDALAADSRTATVASPMNRGGPVPGGYAQQQPPIQQPPTQQPPTQQTGTTAGPAAPHRRRRLVVGAAVLVIVIALAIGLGIWQFAGESAETDADKTTPAVDVSALDMGRYSPEPQQVSGPPTEAEGRYLEAFRLAEALADPYAVDRKLDYRYGLAAPDPELVATTVAGTALPIIQPVLEQFGMISAYQVQGYSERIQDFLRDPNGDALITVVMSFPNPDAAARAAAEIDAVDFAANADNRQAAVPGYPDAKAHYRSGSPSVAATMARGSLVTAVITASSTAPDIDSLLQRVEKVFDLQTPLMANVIPATTVSLTSLPRDPDRILTRVFTTDQQPKISADFGSMGPRAAELCENSEPHKEHLFEQAEVDRCAFSNDAQILRAADEGAASDLLSKTVRSYAGTRIDHDVPAPEGIADARCYEQNQEIWADSANLRFVCNVTYRRYLATVWSNEEDDVRQRAAAQYAILANS